MKFLLGCVMLVASAGALRAQGVTVDRLLAVVNGEVVTLSDVRAARTLRLVPGVETMTDDAVLDALIERKLTVAEVARYSPPDPAPEQVEARRRAWQAALPAGTDVARTLERAGVREPVLMAWLREDLRVAAYIDQRFTAAAQPTRDQALTYFREHPDEFIVNGVTPEFATVEAAVRRKLAADRRAARIREWLDMVRARAEVRRIR